MGFHQDLFWGHYYFWYTLINDLDSGISSDISKFADDSKKYTIIRSQFDVKDLQGDLNRLNEWVVR